jgi:hypothetical protein
MSCKAQHLGWMSLLITVAVLGCSPKPSGAPAADEEAAVRERFAALQSAIEGRDAEKLWAMLDARSRTDAERAAKELREVYNQSGAEEKAKQEEALGLAGTALSKLDGKGFLKSKPFHKKYHEVPEGKIDKIVVQGESATVYFLEPDGDNEKAIFVRQDRQWKAWLPMPRAAAKPIGQNPSKPEA